MCVCTMFNRNTIENYVELYHGYNIKCSYSVIEFNCLFYNVLSVAIVLAKLFYITMIWATKRDEARFVSFQECGHVKKLKL